MRITILRAAVLIIVLLMLGDFVFRGIVPAKTSGKNDFSDPYVGAWLWRHGENPWDSALMSATAKNLNVTSQPLVPIYPLTTYALLTPFSYFSWHRANFLWSFLTVAAACLIPWLLLGIGGFDLHSNKAWLLIGLAISFPPLHRAVHVGNAAVIAIALCLLGIYFAGAQHDVAAALGLALAAGLKPQLGFWILLFYFFRRCWLVIGCTAVVLIALAVAAISRVAAPLPWLMATYKDDLRYWFGPGGPNDFTAANPLHFQLVNSQVIFWQMLHDSTVANRLAVVLFAAGFAVLVYAATRKQIGSEVLLLTALTGLSFVAFYHSVTDITILLLVLSWALSDSSPGGSLMKRLALFSFFLLFLPVHSFLIRTEAEVGPRVSASRLWNLLIGPSYIWMLLLFNLIILVAAAKSVTNCEIPNTKRIRG
jgi:hypothetical protein